MLQAPVLEFGSIGKSATGIRLGFGIERSAGPFQQIDYIKVVDHVDGKNHAIYQTTTPATEKTTGKQRTVGQPEKSRTTTPKQPTTRTPQSYEHSKSTATGVAPTVAPGKSAPRPVNRDAADFLRDKKNGNVSF